MSNYEDETFNLFQIVIKKDLINFFNNNINQYFKEICSNYNNQNSKFVNNKENHIISIENEFDYCYDNNKEKNNKYPFAQRRQIFHESESKNDRKKYSRESKKYPNFIDDIYEEKKVIYQKKQNTRNIPVKIPFLSVKFKNQYILKKI